MTDQHGFVFDDHSDRDLYRSSRTQEQFLNTAIVQSDISGSFEEYLEVFDTFYADHIEVRSEAWEEPARGKARVRSLLFNFLVQLHVIAEVGGLTVSVRETAIHGDAAGETHSAWTLDLVGAWGTTCTLRWRVLRKWSASRVVYEHHYDQEQIGGPMTFDDLRLSAATVAPGFRWPS
jgi:hypothetical protein